MSILTNGISFVEFASPTPLVLANQFEQLGFALYGQHRDYDIAWYRQGEINFLINNAENGYAGAFASAHGPCVCAVAFRVNDGDASLKTASQLGAAIYRQTKGDNTLALPTLYHIGGSLLYLLDPSTEADLWQQQFKPIEKPVVSHSARLTYIDHLTYNLYRGEMPKWQDFHKRLFGFREIDFFDIQGEKTGLISSALASPNNKIRIPLNESKDDRSQIEEFLQLFKGEGVQHIALGSDDIYHSVEKLSSNGIEFLPVPDTYYDVLQTRLPYHQESNEALKKHRILIDGHQNALGQPAMLLQLFTENMLGPVFFEIIQRKGDEGFGKGNFTALFAAIERDQIKRNVL